MPNNTATYWSVDGESLHTFVRSIQSLGGILKPPPVRGENVTIPYQRGRTWVPKIPDEQVLNLGMWLRGVSDTADAGTTGTTRQNFDENWKNIVRLLWRPGQQFELTKRFYDSGILRSATALAEYAGGLAPEMIGKAAGRFVVDLRLADPFFYDDTVQTFNLVNGDQTINVRGNAPTTHIIATINGARNNTIVRVKSPGDDHQMEFHDDVSSGEVVTIDVKNYAATMDPAAGPNYDAEADVRHTGSPYWLILQPGDNIVNLSSSSGIGAVSLQVRGAWV